ncbi:Aspartokinase [Phlyctochytrium planicorne]|nr:Aspartokinase [Phlyctochytrium planicorne]
MTLDSKVKAHHRVVVVVEGVCIPGAGSTRARLTQSLKRCLGDHQSSHATHLSTLAQVERDHTQLLRRTVKDCRFWDDSERCIIYGLHQVRELLNAVQVIGEMPPRTSDQIAAVSDRMAGRIVSAALQYMVNIKTSWLNLQLSNSVGIPATFIDASKLARGDHEAPVGEEFYSDIADQVAALIESSEEEGNVPVITGCFGTFPATQSIIEIHGPSYPTVLATLIASRISLCKELWLVNHHVTAIFTADPRVVPHAVRLKVLTADEAGEMSLMGIGAHLIGSRDGLFIGSSGDWSGPEEGGSTDSGKETAMRILGMDDAERYADQERAALSEAGVLEDSNECGGTLVLPVTASRKAIAENILRRPHTWTALVHRDEVTVFTVRARIHQKSADGENGKGTGNGFTGEGGNTDTLRLLPRIFTIVEEHQGNICSVVTGLKSVTIVVVSKDPDISKLDDIEDASADSKSIASSRKRSNHNEGILTQLQELGYATMNVDFALLTLVGGSRNGNGEMVGNLLAAFNEAGIRLEMCAQVLGGTGISMAVEKARMVDAVRLVHDSCFPNINE